MTTSYSPVLLPKPQKKKKETLKLCDFSPTEIVGPLPGPDPDAQSGLPLLLADITKVSELLSFCSSNRNKASKLSIKNIGLQTKQSKVPFVILIIFLFCFL